MDASSPASPSLTDTADLLGDELFRLDIKIEGFSSEHPSGLKSYYKGRVLKWIVDREHLTVDALQSDLAGVLDYGVNQSAHIWFFDKNRCDDVCLLHDSQLPAMFDMYHPQKFVDLSVKVVNNPNGSAKMQPEVAACSEQISEHSSETKGTECVDVFVDPMAGPEAEPEPILFSEQQEEPIAQVDHQGHPEEVETDPFDNEEEYVGVNDEHLYDNNHVDFPPLEVFTDLPDTDFPDSLGDIPEEVPINDEDPNDLKVQDDPLNPTIEEGALFPDMVTFRKAIRHYAIKNDFEFGGLKTDPTRFIAKCSHEDCPWRIHASRLQDGCTIMIKKLPFEHTCPTTKLLEGKMADQISSTRSHQTQVHATVSAAQKTFITHCFFMYMFCRTRSHSKSPHQEASASKSPAQEGRKKSAASTAKSKGEGQKKKQPVTSPKGKGKKRAAAKGKKKDAPSTQVGAKRKLSDWLVDQE